jgi:hypothetical protein
MSKCVFCAAAACQIIEKETTKEYFLDVLVGFCLTVHNNSYFILFTHHFGWHLHWLKNQNLINIFNQAIL